MQGKYAILIDAGFLKEKLGSQQSPLTAEQVAEFIDKLKKRSELSNLSLHRIHYYDAEPLNATKQKSLGGGEINFKENPLYQENIKLLEELKKKPYFAVRLGELAFTGWRIKQNKLKAKDKTEITITHDDLAPNIKQKQVDIKIGLDIATLTLKNQIDIIVFITADSDFIPALKFARREGKQIFLYTLGHNIHKEFYAHCDRCIEDKKEALLKNESC